VVLEQGQMRRALRAIGGRVDRSDEDVDLGDARVAHEAAVSIDSGVLGARVELRFDRQHHRGDGARGLACRRRGGWVGGSGLAARSQGQAGNGTCEPN
jgi:hypothetical protein